MWFYKGKEFKQDDVTAKHFGFVYIITELSSGKVYIGQKQFWSKKPKVTAGKKKMITVHSDWIAYRSSSEYLKTVDEDGLRKEILYMTASKGQSNYIETMVQMDLRVLEHPDVYLNKIMNFRCHHTHVKLHTLIDKDDELIKKLYSNSVAASVC